MFKVGIRKLEPYLHRSINLLPGIWIWKSDFNSGSFVEITWIWYAISFNWYHNYKDD